MTIMKHSGLNPGLNMSQEVEIEISKLLLSSFSGGAPVGMNDLARMWSLEMQWFSPDAASSLVGRLQLAGWLVGGEDSLEPCDSILQHTPELGWRPFLSRFEEIPKPPEIEGFDEGLPPSASPSEDQGQRQPITESTIGKLASMVSSMSGLDRREVVRRAERKRRALGSVSIEIAMLLLAREQNLEMDELTGILD